jgi:hypothetical protein
MCLGVNHGGYYKPGGRRGSRTVPVGDVLVGDAGSNIKHDDTALSVDVVSISETTELLLTGGIPDVKGDLAEVLSLEVSMCAQMTTWTTTRAGKGNRLTYGGEA